MAVLVQSELSILILDASEPGLAIEQLVSFRPRPSPQLDDRNGHHPDRYDKDDA